MNKVQIAKERRVEKIVINIAHSSLYDDLFDLCQITYGILLDSDDAKIIQLWEGLKIDYFITRIIKNQYRSVTSPFYATYRRFKKQSVEISKYVEEYGLKKQ
ncbi:MAG: hypothetical protein NC308_01435 [Clostridium sp.]|nr:hypothetical protein [Bacteroides sp.]MCM1197528.1 hypothetical protein [Clostridium sp.]